MTKRRLYRHLKKAWLVPGLLTMAAALSPVAAQSVYRGGMGSPADTEVRLQQMETDLRDVRGQLERQSHDIRMMQDKLDKALSDIELRLGDMEKGGGGAGFSSPPMTGSDMTVPEERAPDSSYTYSSRGSSNAEESPPSAYTAETPVTDSKLVGDAAAVKYERAFSLLKSGDYESASRDFQDFIDQYPNHVLIGNAKYWLGETYYVRGQYEKAARIFADGYRQFPKGAKAADNLLKLGMSLAGMGKKTDACVALGQVGKDFAGSSTPVLKRAEQEMTRLGCG